MRRFLKIIKKIIDISCGSGHMGLINNKNQLLMVGRGKEGQLGRADMIESSAGSRSLPRLIEFF